MSQEIKAPQPAPEALTALAHLKAEIKKLNALLSAGKDSEALAGIRVLSLAAGLPDRFIGSQAPDPAREAVAWMLRDTSDPNYVPWPTRAGSEAHTCAAKRPDFECRPLVYGDIPAPEGAPVAVPSHWLQPGAAIPVTAESVQILRDALRAALAAPAPQAAPDMVSVPVDPTPEMVMEGGEVLVPHTTEFLASLCEQAETVYRAMLAAAPQTKEPTNER